MQFDKFFNTPPKMRKILFLFLTLGLITACSSDDSSSDNATSATINLKDASGNPLPNVVVYAYSEVTWEMMGDEPFFSDFQASSDSQGKAVFESIDSETIFHDINNYQNTFRFSAHYTLGGVEKTKVVAITFKKGNNKTETLTLN